MEFRRVRDSVRRLLAAQAAGKFRVLGMQKAGKGAAAVSGDNSLVEVYYSEGAFPKSGGALTGPTRHDLTFRIALTVSEAAAVDVATIEAEGATAEQIASAIVAMRESGALADLRLDALFERVYQILMDARNVDLGLAAGDGVQAIRP